MEFQCRKCLRVFRNVDLLDGKVVCPVCGNESSFLRSPDRAFIVKLGVNLKVDEKIFYNGKKCRVAEIQKNGLLLADDEKKIAHYVDFSFIAEYLKSSADGYVL